MSFLWWTALVLLLLLGIPCIVFFGLFLATGEPLARQRAAALYRWCVVVVLGSFNIWIFGRVIAGIRDLIR